MAHPKIYTDLAEAYTAAAEFRKMGRPDAEVVHAKILTNTVEMLGTDEWVICLNWRSRLTPPPLEYEMESDAPDGTCRCDWSPEGYHEDGCGRTDYLPTSPAEAKEFIVGLLREPHPGMILRALETAIIALDRMALTEASDYPDGRPAEPRDTGQHFPFLIESNRDVQVFITLGFAQWVADRWRIHHPAAMVLPAIEVLAGRDGYVVALLDTGEELVGPDMPLLRIDTLWPEPAEPDTEQAWGRSDVQKRCIRRVAKAYGASLVANDHDAVEEFRYLFDLLHEVR